MTYHIAYGIETESLEAPDQLRLLSLPDEVADMDNDDLAAYISDTWTTIRAQVLVGADDVVQALRMLMRAQKIDNFTVEVVIDGLRDALDNNA